MSDAGLKTHPVARLAAIVPLLLMAGAVIAYMMGFRLEGRRPYVPEWRTLAVAESNFSVVTPGLFITSRQPMVFEGETAEAQVYVASDLAVDFIALAVRRPDGDVRPPAEVAKSLGLSGTETAPRADGFPAFRQDVAQGGKRTQALLIFRDRMMYQLMVTGPTASFPVANAERFFASFRLIGPT